MPGFDVSDLSAREMYKLLIGPIVPRPIAWVSTVSAGGQKNLAPFSYFNAVSSNPPMLGFSVSEPKMAHKTAKDTLTHLRETNDFVVNIANADLLDQVFTTAFEYPVDVDEFAVAKLTAVSSETVSAPRVLEAPVSYECVVHTIVPVGSSHWVIGRVTYVHVRQGLIDENFRTDLDVFKPLGRMPGPSFTTEMNSVLPQFEPVVE